jgi:adenylate cyclase
VLVLQGEVARAIAGELQGALTPEQTSQLAEARPVDPDAYDAYLKGSFHWKELTPENLVTAQRYFERALEKDPEYAPAYEGLAWVWLARNQFFITPPDEARPQVNAAALRAIELDDRSAGAHEALAVARYTIDCDWAGSEEEFRRALELDPDRANTHAYFAHLLVFTGRPDEAVPHSERAVELDPFNALFHSLCAATLYMDRRYDDALAAARTALEIQPGEGISHDAVYDSLYAKATRDEDLALQRGRIAHDPELAAAFDQGLAKGGSRGAMRAVAELLAARWEESGGAPGPGGGPFYIGMWYNFAGEYDRQIDWLEEAFEVRDPNLPYIAPWPTSDALRSDPRFQDLLRRMNLPQAEALD